MKILFTTSNLEKTGGIQAYNRSLLNVLKLNVDKVDILEIKKSSFLYKIVFIFKYFFKVLFNRPDIVFCTHINFSYLGLLSKIILVGVDYIVFTHGVEAWIPRKKYSFQTIKKAEKVVSVSRHTAFQLESIMPSLKDKIFILPDTVNENKFKPKSKPNKLIGEYNLEDSKVLFTLTRMNFWDKPKGYDQVLKSLPEIKKEYPNIKYILGGEGDDLNRVKKLVKDLDLEDNVILPGHIPDDELVDYYNLSDLFVMPSKKEGFGIVFIEALACGKPVIAGDRDGARDALLDGKLGFLVNPNDLDSLTKTIINVLEKNVDNEDLINPDYLREKVIKEYGIQSFNNKTKKLIQSLR